MPTATRPGRLARSAARLRRSVILADEREQERRRRLLSGRTIPAATVGRTWQELVAAGPRVTGPASLNSDHPSHAYRPTALHPVAVDPRQAPAWAAELYLAVPRSTTLRRRERRALARSLRGAGQYVKSSQ